MKITLEVTQIDGNTFQVTTSLPVIIAWERKFKRKAAELADGNIGLEDMAFWAYEAAKRSNIPVPMSLDGFIDKLDSVDVVQSEIANPTDADHTDGN